MDAKLVEGDLTDMVEDMVFDLICAGGPEYDGPPPDEATEKIVRAVMTYLKLHGMVSNDR